MKPAADALVFQWGSKHRSFLLLFWFFILSLCVHALALYIFQVKYPSTVSIAPPPVQVSLLTPSMPEYRALTRWIEAGNPALAMSPPDIAPPGMLEPAYKPSYSTVRAQPRLAEDQNEPVRFPPVIDSPGIIAASATNQTRIEAAPFSPKTSSLRLSGALADRKIKKQTEIPPAQKSSAPLKPSRFMIGVNDRGEIRYVFLEESCGEKTMDQWAQIHLQTQVEFASDPQPITWGVATYFWGDDAYLPAR